MSKIVTSGKRYQHFLTSAEFPYSEEEQACIESTVSQLIDTETQGSKPGMLLGMIQSGKTKTFLAATGLAFDNGYDIAVVLTKGTKALAKQTEQRIQREFKPFCESDDILVFDIMNMPDHLSGWELKRKLILVVKKQKDNLERLLKLFSTKHKLLAEKRALIIDDEADYASVGYKRQEGEIDANLTAKKLDKLRSSVKQASFLQVTATPYSLYLQPEGIKVKGIEFLPVRPAFTALVPVHEAYIGSEYYFESEFADLLHVPLAVSELLVLRKRDGRRLKIDEVLTTDAIAGLRAAFCNFLVGGAVRHLQAKADDGPISKYSFLVHTEVSKGAHSWQEELVNAIADRLTSQAKKNSKLFKELVEAAYQELSPGVEKSGFYMPGIDQIMHRCREALLDGELLITSINSDKQVEALLDETGQLKLRTPFNIFIGGQILDRGITIGGMIGFYYGRRPNRFQQDTVLQHSRMYGYRSEKDMAVTRFYTEPSIYQAMQRMHESDKALREAIAKNPKQEVIFIQGASSGNVVPCSPNKLLLSETTTLKPFKRILPVGFQTDYKTYTNRITKNIDELLVEARPTGASAEPFKIKRTLAHEILNEAEQAINMEADEGYTFDWAGMHAAIDYMAGLSPNPEEIWCLWLSDRNNARMAGVGSHTRYVATPDTATSEGATARAVAKDTPMLMLFRQNGAEEKGWMDAPFYWPLLVAPGNIRTAIYANESID
tara:strand:- start:15277 stop:17433 length:2157 start_codon:yes stop_codon:yes gene_type:complete